MPVPTTRNPTIRERWRTYSTALKETYPNVEKLVHEVEQGKKFLEENGNTVISHNIFCTWRVVLLDRFCLVQNYFPNNEGLSSDCAPTFVYENTGRNSYYLTYDEMFRLTKKIATEALGNAQMGIPP